MQSAKANFAKSIGGTKPLCRSDTTRLGGRESSAGTRAVGEPSGKVTSVGSSGIALVSATVGESRRDSGEMGRHAPLLETGILDATLTTTVEVQGQLVKMSNQKMLPRKTNGYIGRWQRG